MSDFSFEDLEAQFAELDALLKAEGISSEPSGRAPAWLEVSRQALVDDHEENCSSPDPERCMEEFEEFADKQLRTVVQGQLIGELEIRVEGEIDEERHGRGDDAQFTITFNGRLGRILCHALQSAVPAMQVKSAMDAAMKGILGIDDEDTQDELKALEALRWLLTDVGSGKLDEALLPQES